MHQKTVFPQTPGFLHSLHVRVRSVPRAFLVATMNNGLFIRLSFCLALISFGCSEDLPVSPELTQSEQGSVLGKGRGATQISGVSVYAETDQCDSQNQGADYSLVLTGDIEGCWDVFVEDFECSPSGTYREEGYEIFTGTYNGVPGTFRTAYQFHGRYEGCAEDGSPIGAEIFGRCQHPIVGGSGEGVFGGVTGRLDFKDDVEAQIFPYRGHLRF